MLGGGKKIKKKIDVGGGGQIFLLLDSGHSDTGKTDTIFS